MEEREQTKRDMEKEAKKNKRRKFIKGKLLWWRQGMSSTVILTLLIGSKSNSAPEHIEIDEYLFQKFYKKVGNPTRKIIIYENGILKLEKEK